MSKFAAALLCGAIAVTPAISLANADSNLEEIVVQMADTPQEHAGLARYYQAKAEEARSEASRHDRMGRTYHNGKLTQRNRMKQHCQKIFEQYTKMATEYDELAKLHDEKAK